MNEHNKNMRSAGFRYYEEIARGYEELHREEQLSKLKLVLDKMPHEKEDTLLDVGCGTGLSSSLFNCKKVGVDPAKELLLQAKNRLPAVQGVAEHLPFLDKSFSLLVCLTALHNFADPEKALQEMKRVCSGRAAISVLKQAKGFDKLLELVSKTFKVKEMLEESRDIILFCI